MNAETLRAKLQKLLSDPNGRRQEMALKARAETRPCAVDELAMDWMDAFEALRDKRDVFKGKQYPEPDDVRIKIL